MRERLIHVFALFDSVLPKISICINAGVPFSRIQREGCSREVRERAQAAVAELMEAYGCMMLRDGLFHADPHSGNLLLQVTHLPTHHQRQQGRL